MAQKYKYLPNNGLGGLGVCFAFMVLCCEISELALCESDRLSSPDRRWGESRGGVWLWPAWKRGSQELCWPSSACFGGTSYPGPRMLEAAGRPSPLEGTLCPALEAGRQGEQDFGGWWSLRAVPGEVLGYKPPALLSPSSSLRGSRQCELPTRQGLCMSECVSLQSPSGLKGFPTPFPRAGGTDCLPSPYIQGPTLWPGFHRHLGFGGSLVR